MGMDMRAPRLLREVEIIHRKGIMATTAMRMETT